MDESTCERVIVSRNRPSKLDCGDLIVNFGDDQRSEVNGRVARRNAKHSLAYRHVYSYGPEGMRDDVRYLR